MRTSADGTEVWFEPVGLFLSPGSTVRWILEEANPHTTTAYHPSNGDRPARIPSAAEPWDSGYLQEPGATFEKTFSVAGVYDYFCKPHEAAGMVGRIVVGNEGRRLSESETRATESPDNTDLPEAARNVLPSVERIVREKRVRWTER